MDITVKNELSISAIVPARNEEAVITACVESLAQQEEIAEILVVNDHSTDRTAEILNELMQKHPKVRLLESTVLPDGWVGKNHAASQGASEAKENWLLFTDADVLHGKNSAAKALEIAEDRDASLVSFSPEQITETWYEKALIPVVYCRLARKFSFEVVNDPVRSVAAANGQFLMLTRRAYDAVGGHASISGEVLEDVALAQRVKDAGYLIWFGSGKGIVGVRMYRRFDAMWEGWKKNLYQLMGGEPRVVSSEIIMALAPILVLCLVIGAFWAWRGNWQGGLLSSSIALGIWHWLYARELKRNEFPTALAWYGIPGKLLYAGILWASFRSHQKGSLVWKGREYPVGTSGASKR